MTNHMPDEEISQAKERVLNVAEKLFSERGYTSVSLRDIAGVLGMHQSSLYNHAAGGKEELFVTVMQRACFRHQRGLENAIASAEPNLQAQLQAIAEWLLAHPPLNLNRLRYSDLPELSPENARYLSQLLYNSLFVVIESAVESAVRRGEARSEHASVLSGTFVAAIEAFRNLPYTKVSEQQQAEKIIKLLLEGVQPR
jgi:TetR/AcrR family transcriptional regulator, cholesterol catabolism regulator